MDIKTPELDKIAKVREKSQTIGEFLDWLKNEQHREIAYWIEDSYTAHLNVDNRNIETLLYEYFDIDAAKAENERRAILDAIRASK